MQRTALESPEKTALVRSESITRSAPSEHPVQAFSRAVGIVWRRELIRFGRSPMRVTTSLAQPVLYLFVFGVGLGRLIGGSMPAFDFKAFLFPGVVIMTIIFSAVFSAVSIVWDREFGFMREMLVAPVPRSGLVVGKALGGASVSTIQGALVLVFAPAVGVRLSLPTLAAGLGIMALCAFSLTSLGIVVAARIQRIESFQAVMQFFLMPIFFLSGALYPVETLPSWLGALARLDPATYGVTALRRLLLGSSPTGGLGTSLTIFGRTLSVGTELLILLGVGVLMCALAVQMFRKVE